MPYDIYPGDIYIRLCKAFCHIVRVVSIFILLGVLYIMLI